MSNDHNDHLIVNYHDAAVYQSDLNLLLGRSKWLNDACINFGMTHLAVHKKTNDGEDERSPFRMEFLDPSVISYFMHQLSLDDECDIDELRNLYSIWGLSTPLTSEELSRDYRILHMLFLPINDNNSTGFGSGVLNTSDGNHWSFLLAVIVNGNNVNAQFFHFDSSAGYNHQSAIAVSKRIRDIIIVGSSKPIDDVNVIECQVPQQVNGYDCGLHTLVTAEVVSRAIDCQAIDLMTKNDTISFKKGIEEKVNTFMGKFGSTCEMGKEARAKLARNIALARE